MIVHALALAAVLSLGRAESFSILGGSGVTATGTMRVTGDVSMPATGLSPVVGKIRSAAEPLKDAAKAWNELEPLATTAVPFDRTFDGDAVRVFRLDSLMTVPDSTMRLVNGAQSSHIFWLVNGSATLGARSTFIGTLIATSNITVEEGVTVAGRLISLSSTVTLDTDDINLCCDPDDGTPHTYSLFSASLPPGTTLNRDGTLLGTPPPGTYTFILLAQDFKGCTRIETRTIVVCEPSPILPTTLPDAIAGFEYKVTIRADGTHRFTSADLPEWLSLANACGPSALLSGIPPAFGQYTFTIAATDCDGTCSGSRKYTLNVACPEITIVPDTLLAGTVGTPYTAIVHATGGTPPYRYDASPPATIDQNGVLSLPTNAAAKPTVVVRATDVCGCSGTRSYEVEINCPDVTFSPASLPDGSLNEPYDVQFDGPYTFTSPDLPSWLTLTLMGHLHGVPAEPADYTFTVIANVLTCSVPKTYTVHVPQCPIITISPATLPRGTVLVPYSRTIVVTGCASPCTISVSGNIPTGLSPPLTLSGVPNTLGVFKFTVKATDPQGCFALQTYTIAIVPPSVPGAVIPMLGSAALLMLSLVLACAGLVVLRRMS